MSTSRDRSMNAGFEILYGAKSPYISELCRIFADYLKVNTPVITLRVSEEDAKAFYETDLFDRNLCPIQQEAFPGYIGCFLAARVFTDKRLSRGCIEVDLETKEWSGELLGTDVLKLADSMTQPVRCGGLDYPDTSNCPCGIRRAVCDYHRP